MEVEIQHLPERLFIEIANNRSQMPWVIVLRSYNTSDWRSLGCNSQRAFLSEGWFGLDIN